MLSVTLVHPAKAIGQNEMSFGRYTHVVPSIIVLDWSPSSPMGRIDLWSESPVSRDAAYRRITLALVIDEYINGFCDYSIC